MKKSTLCFCIKDDQVLLGMKKEGFGEGKWNGFGGKVEEGETPVAAAVRELGEESSLVANTEDLKQVAIVRFYFDENPKFECHVYIANKWTGDPVEGDEMRPQWFPIETIPYDEMWAADAQWISLILKGDKIEAEVVFNHDGSGVKSFTYKEVEFK